MADEMSDVCAKLPRRLIERIDFSGACWEWCGSLSSGSYGKTRLGAKTVSAHRAVWTLYCGDPGPALHVCHHCDNRRCVRPSHLFLGTRSDNMRDCIAKGRHPAKRKFPKDHFKPKASFTVPAVGERGSNARLTADEVMAIREAKAAGEQLKSIAERFGISAAHAKDLAAGRAWRHIPLASGARK